MTIETLTRLFTRVIEAERAEANAMLKLMDAEEDGRDEATVTRLRGQWHHINQQLRRITADYQGALTEWQDEVIRPVAFAQADRNEHRRRAYYGN